MTLFAQEAKWNRLPMLLFLQNPQKLKHSVTAEKARAIGGSVFYPFQPVIS